MSYASYEEDYINQEEFERIKKIQLLKITDEQKRPTVEVNEIMINTNEVSKKIR